jgi:hypothetical protein
MRDVSALIGGSLVLSDSTIGAYGVHAMPRTIVTPLDVVW